MLKQNDDEITERFPRVQKIRYDKSWDDCMTLTQVRKLVEDTKGRLGRKKVHTNTYFTSALRCHRCFDKESRRQMSHSILSCLVPGLGDVSQAGELALQYERGELGDQTLGKKGA